jgi:hypothetical protein
VAKSEFPDDPRKPKKRAASTEIMPQKITRIAGGIGFTTGGPLLTDKLNSLA